MRSSAQEKHHMGGPPLVGPCPVNAHAAAPSGAQAVAAADRFESEADSIAEDQTRLQALRDYMPIIGPVGWANIGYALRQAAAFVVGRPTPRLHRRHAMALVRKLDPEAEGVPPTLASAMSMRRIRVEVIGALIDALADYSDEELCTVTIVKPAWIFTEFRPGHPWRPDLWPSGPPPRHHGRRSRRCSPRSRRARRSPGRCPWCRRSPAPSSP